MSDKAMITGLPQKWCESIYNEGFIPQLEEEIGQCEYESGRKKCADELSAALSTWTKITEAVARDTSHRNTKWLVHTKDYGTEILDGAVLIMRLGGSFRPLCDLDSPPEDKS